MMKFVENPNLPVCADIVIIGEKYCKILQTKVVKLFLILQVAKQLL